MTVYDILQIVDGISETPTVLLDLNNGEPFRLEKDGFTSSPPELRRSSVTPIGDGDVTTSSSYGSRDIEMSLLVLSLSQNQALEAMQALQRFLDAEGFWLKRVPRGGSDPTFYRVERSAIAGVKERDGQGDGQKTLDVTVRAEPCGYGLPVSGSFLVGANPASGGVSYVWPDEVQGDVPAPLQLSHPVDYVAPEGYGPSYGRERAWFSTAAAEACPVTWVPHSAMTIGSSGGGLTLSTVSDSGRFMTGSAFRLAGTKSGESTVATGSTSLAAGNYRVYGRIASSDIGAGVVPAITWRMYCYPYGDGPMVEAKHETSDQNIPGWVDLGLARLPKGAPLADGGSMAWGASGEAVAFQVKAVTAGVVAAHFEGLLFVPAGLDEASASRYLGVRAPSSSRIAYLDGIGQASSFVDVASMPMPPEVASIEGLGWPALVPGQVNTLHSMSRGTVASLPEPSLPVTFRYFPRYLYARPALS